MWLNSQKILQICYQFFDSDNSFLQHLNFTKDEIIILHHGIEGIMNQTGKRKRSLKMCSLDSVIIFFLLLKHGHEFKLIAKIFGFTTNLIQKSIDRMRSPFYQYLSQKWWNYRKPLIAMEVNYPYLSLAINSTSLKVFRPHGIESNAKKMYDSKNKINAIKKEVAVMTTPLHYALFSQKGFLGSEHDFSAFKRNYINYVDYLKKLLSEEKSLDIDSRWGVVLDSGYLDNSCETPELRKFAMNRPLLVKPDEIHYQSELASKRGCVKRFFGEIKKIIFYFSLNLQMGSQSFQYRFRYLCLFNK
ncbi:hypothetical protein A3Q56_07944 [Intoshia linei]|uniref:DDE Tnp4 domain-containing protein n=1 Tax=Intoshia linei TaxID=1819745 RepID=A0A177ASH0_9BILA|nr:hypothetical protein A3Q56_07944 [Intoshia linei]